MARASRTPYAVLTMLSLDPRSRYDIQRAFQASMRYFWNESNGQLYPALRTLVTAGPAARTRPSARTARTPSTPSPPAAGRNCNRGLMAPTGKSLIPFAVRRAGGAWHVDPEPCFGLILL